MAISDEEEYWLLQKWFSQTFFEAWKVIPQVFYNPSHAQLEMNRLERHSIYQLHRVAKLGIKGGA